MILVGLTGSIGTGKSTTAALFAECGAPVFDADAVVRALYAPDGDATAVIAEHFPDCVDENGVDRNALRARVQDDPSAFALLETLVHPLVGRRRRSFLRRAQRRGAPFVVLDVPLLFETGGDESVDVIVVVSAPADVQRERVLARPGMTEDAFEAILARQLPDEEKRARADFIIDTSRGIPDARRQVRAVARRLTQRAKRKERGYARNRFRR